MFAVTRDFDMLHIDITRLDEVVGRDFLRCGGCAVPLQILRFTNQIKNDFAQRPANQRGRQVDTADA